MALPDPTPTLRTLYFAYGTNLSPTQLSLRCPTAPTSSHPLAIARLPNYKWFIQRRRGCANIRPSPPTPTSSDEDSGDEVWGVLYAMHPADVAILDTYEGVDPDAPASHQNGNDIARPTEQGRGRHNKVFLGVEVVRWIRDAHQEFESREAKGTVRALVYVDEMDTEEGVVRGDYVGRMNRGVREAVELGLSEEWVRRVVRMWVREGVEAEDRII
ncbi:hypothetical protein P171DRAFT_476421 [Karstenula rhodostoma CBS 690.94]|uniref:gamma-glutamylcyclotransferase n=1 Tax=Karstenula rhodostoma CBS 690.94 TaxID=1392251 RepID=A0A9P4U8C9_9PLEO|nr:hypothetical protein P171DRAFT_476421 [Karstenula rhodostoma CBS 690.94]